MRHIFVFGDSHTRAIRQAASSRADRLLEMGFAIEAHWMLSARADRTLGDLGLDDAVVRVSQLGPDDVVAITLAGTLHNIIGLVQHEVPFDLMSKASCDVAHNSGRVIIPRRVIEAFFEARIRRGDAISKLRAAAAGRVVHLATPPPKGDDGFIAAMTARYRDKVVAEAGITPANIRLKLWELEMELVQRVCAGWGVGFLPPPPGTQEDGFLAPEYYGNDATHANVSYGNRVLDQLLRLEVANA